MFFVAEPPEVSLELQQQFVPWGQNARFSCSIRGNPLPSVVWLRNAAPLSQSQRHRLTKRVLRVLNVGPQDDGIYQCMAENEVGSSQGAARLITVPAGEWRYCSSVTNASVLKLELSIPHCCLLHTVLLNPICF